MLIPWTSKQKSIVEEIPKIEPLKGAFYSGMHKVPVTFDHEGRRYTGTFDEVFGAGSKVWHLMIDNFYYGRLRLTDTGWIFDPTPKTESMAELANFFGVYNLMVWVNEIGIF